MSTRLFPALRRGSAAACLNAAVNEPAREALQAGSASPGTQCLHDDTSARANWKPECANEVHICHPNIVIPLTFRSLGDMASRLHCSCGKVVRALNQNRCCN